MERIEQIANDFMTAYNSGDKVELTKRSNSFLIAILSDEYQFTKITHTYMVARALYYLWRNSNRLDDNECNAITRLLYYCLLRNYAENANIEPTDTKYSDMIGGCELATVVICDNGGYLAHQVLAVELEIILPFAERKMTEQLILFAGMVKEANTMGYYQSLDAQISAEFKYGLREIYNTIPIGENLQPYKDKWPSLVGSIAKDIAQRIYRETNGLLF